jgi:acyl-coenzyme A thioesterase PaaI-like protein
LADVTSDWINGMGGLHGAASCFIVDMITGASFARLRTPTWDPMGPSLSIDMNYYAPAPS